MKNMKTFEGYKMENMMGEGKYDKVLEYSNGWLKENKFCGEAYFYKAYALTELKDCEKAENVLFQALDVCLEDEELAMIYLQKSSLAESLGKLDEALLAIDKAIDFNPDVVEFYVLKTSLLYKMNMFSKAIWCNQYVEKMDYEGKYIEEVRLMRKGIRISIDKVIRGEIDLVE